MADLWEVVRLMLWCVKLVVFTAVLASVTVMAVVVMTLFFAVRWVGGMNAVSRVHRHFLQRLNAVWDVTWPKPNTT